MKPLTCAAARRRLHAFCDGELPVSEQIAVESHIDWCDACAQIVAEVRLVGSALRVGALGRDWLSQDEAVALAAAVVGRRSAEQELSWIVRARRLFEDMHFVYAGLGAAAAAGVCIVIMLSMMRFATAGRPDSLAALFDLMATPGSSANTTAIDPASYQRWSARFQAANESAEEDAVFALSAIISRDGSLANIHRLRSNRHKATREQANLIEALVDAVTRARIEPASIDAARTNGNMVWFVTRTTVRATKMAGADVVLPATGKKRTAQVGDSASVRA
jgi:anti-sigma factor RsiW